MIPFLYQNEAGAGPTTITGNDTVINVGTHALSDTESGYKVNILAYNRVSSSGDALTSIVTVSAPLLADSSDPITYRPKNLYSNTSFDKSLDWGLMDSPEDFSFFNVINKGHNYNINKEQSRFACNNSEEFVISQKPAPLISDKYTLMDGYYTIVSLGLWNVPTPEAVAEMSYTPWSVGDLGITEGINALFVSSNNLQIWNGTMWVHANIVSSEVPLSSCLKDSFKMRPGNEMQISYFFWQPENDSIFRELSTKVIDNPELTSELNEVYSKIMTIDMYGRTGEFGMAQLINQLSDYFKVVNT